MIIVYHQNNKVDTIYDYKRQQFLEVVYDDVLKEMRRLAISYKDRILVWCQLELKQNLNVAVIPSLFVLKNTMLSFGGKLLSHKIGYVDSSPFLNVKVSVCYPTWLMSADMGAIHTSTLVQFESVSFTKNFSYDLTSIAKLGMPQGLLCYSEPKLVLKASAGLGKTANLLQLFRFVKQHYSLRWTVILFLNLIWHECKFPIIPFLICLFFKRRYCHKTFALSTSDAPKKTELPTIDVIIPTIGRPNYVHNVVKDLAQQTHLPKSIIIIEQHPDFTSTSDLDFIYSKSWPFAIKHQFIHQTGACNARNLALKEVTAEFVYLADDDIEFDRDLLEKVLFKMWRFNLDVVSMSCIQKDEVEQKKVPLQWPAFGAGCSILKSKLLDVVTFNMALEFGYSEDVDFGCQLRNNGVDIIYLPYIKTHHLKAPIGGFRSTFKHLWREDSILPKPAPTVMLNSLLNKTNAQLLGYKTQLCINYYFVQKIKHPLRYYRMFLRQWDRSKYWAEHLQSSNKERK